ncbi:MAG TPA: hypothetical protein VFH27_14740, partial [Longimicrobiaceae bacterium]|nr:hypothetical protein [Longimicrobiaceae bacterium]
HSRAAEIARGVVARGQYLRIGRDTVLPATFHATGDVVILAPADVKLEGQVDGAIAILGGQLYLRPGSRVGGPIGVLGGGVYPSARATYDEIAESGGSTSVQVHADTSRAGDPSDDVVRSGSDSTGAVTATASGGDSSAVAVDVASPSRSPAFRLRPSPLPTYERVDGFSVSVGAAVLLRGRDDGPAAEAWGTVRQFNRPGGGARLTLPFWENQVSVAAEASRGTRTNDAWAVGDIGNSAAALFAGTDYRDYYEADRASLTVMRPYSTPIISPESWLGPHARVMVEKAESRSQRATWSLLGGDGLERENPEIDAGTLVSAAVGFGYRKRWLVSRFDGDVQAERGIAAAGDFGFTQLTVDGRYQGRALRLHTLEVRFHGMLPVGGDGAPRQRWGILGGAPTLPTLAIGSYRGDHLAYVASTYGIPLPMRLKVPVVGLPTIQLWHGTGAAWATGDDMPRWTQNVGAGVAFPLVTGRVVIDPAADSIKPKFMFWATLPGA